MRVAAADGTSEWTVNKFCIQPPVIFSFGSVFFHCGWKHPPPAESGTLFNETVERSDVHGAQSPVEYVCASDVRVATLDALADCPRQTADLLSDVEASESAVYDAINGLVEHGLLEEAGERSWRPTGAGWVLIELLAERRRTDRLLGTDPEYWRAHDVTALPEEFRRRLTSLVDFEVIHATETEPNRVVREIVDRLTDAERMDIVTPIYHEQFAEAFQSSEEHGRLLLHASVIDDLVDRLPESELERDLPVRIGEPSFAMTITDAELLLSLPFTDGGYDAQSELIAEHDRALEWGSRLFERQWERAMPIEQYAREHLDIGE